MKKYMITGAVAAAMLALSACGQGEDYSANEGLQGPDEMADNSTMTDQDRGYGADGAPLTRDPATSTTPSSTAMNTEDAQSFVDMASQANLAEIKTSEIAATKASTKEVKDYAAMIIEDHKAAGEALKTAMAGAQLTPPSMMLDEDHQRRVDDISAERQGSTANAEEAGVEWDHDYMAMQIDMHQDAIDLFEDYAKNGDNAALQTFAQSTLPTLKEHLAKAQEIEGMVDDNNILTPG